jgi:hypothetical protein
MLDRAIREVPDAVTLIALREGQRRHRGDAAGAEADRHRLLELGFDLSKERRATRLAATDLTFAPSLRSSPSRDHERSEEQPLGRRSAHASVAGRVSRQTRGQ